MCSMIVCVLLPRFALSVAAGGRAELARGPVALAPEPGREPLIGEASAAAEAHGVRAGLRLGEALARCPTLKLVSPDPAGVADQWDRVLAALEGIGAAVESERAGVACFDASGLLKLHGGLDGVLGGHPPRPRRPRPPRRRPARASPPSPPPPAPARGGRRWRRERRRSAAARRRERPGPGAAAAATRSPPTSPRCPIALLGTRAETAGLPEPLERFGIRTLGELAALPRAALADRFGAAGPLARDLARGRDTPLVPRRAAERLEEALELPESGSGTQLEHALNLLIDRLVARRERRGRTFRSVVLSAALVEGGTWRLRMTFREAHADPRRMRLALAPRLAELPAPADVLRLRVEGLGPPAGLQRSLIAEPAAIRAARLREAVRQARAVAGPDAALRDRPRRPRLARARAPPHARAVGPVSSRRPHAGREPRAAPARHAAPGSRPRRGGRAARGGGRARRRGRARVLAGGGPLVVGSPAAPPLLGGRDRRRAQPRRLPRARRRPLVRTALSAAAECRDMPYLAASDRYDAMTYRRCGRSGLQLPAISLGLWNNFGDDEPARRPSGRSSAAPSTSGSPTSISPTTTARRPARPSATSAASCARTSRPTATS